VAIALTDSELAVKKGIVKEVYGFQEGSFEFEAAGSAESFSTLEAGGLKGARK
jgi:hypothetical protein